MVSRASKSSVMLRIPNELVPQVTGIVSEWRSTGAMPTLAPPALPEPFGGAWQGAVGEHNEFFQSWAMTAFLLRWGFVDPSDCSMLPWIVRSEDAATSFQVAATAEAAVELARSEGLIGGVAAPGWL